jgi:AGCS family alanine or glycine:cation symporter
MGAIEIIFGIVLLLFSIAIILALGFMGAMVQSNSIATNMTGAFGIPGWVVGIVLAAICAFIFLGGIQRIAAVAEKIVPFMAIIYLVLGLIVLIVKIADVPAAFGMIFKYAFQPQAIIGGGFGYAIAQAISQGAKRGLFSNEAGMGSTPHAHAVAKVEKPHDQGVVAMIGVFIDTFVVLTMTALVTITCLYAGDNPAITVDGAIDGLTKANMMQMSMTEVFGGTLGPIAVAVCLLFFAFTTIISWNFFGKQNVLYLFGKNGKVGLGNGD